MGDRLTGTDLPNNASTKPWQGLGLNASGIFGWQLDTAISDGGGSLYGLGLDFGYAATDLDKYKLLLQIIRGSTEGGYLPTGGPSVPQTHGSNYLGSEHERVLGTFYDPKSRPTLALSTASQRLVGYGSSYFQNPYEDGGAGEDTFDLSSSTYLLGKVRLGSQVWLELGPGLSYGVQYAGEGSEFNRLQLAFMLQSRIGWNAESTVSAKDRDTYVETAANISAFYAMMHSYALRYALNNTLTNPQNDLEDYGFESNMGSEESALDTVPSYMFASTLLGGLSSSLETPLRSKAYWGYFAMHLAGGLAFLTMEGEAAKQGATGDFLGAARLASYAMAEIESPGRRIGMGEREKALREGYLNIANFSLASGLLGFGQAFNADPISGAAAGSGMSIASSPNQITDMLETTLYIPGYTPATGRMTFTLHNEWEHLPMFSAMTAAWGGTDKPIDINSSMGAQWSGPYHYLFGGLNHNMSYGEEGGSTLGLVAGVAAKIARQFVIDGRIIYNPWNPQNQTDVVLGLTYRK